jgi:hypothetical protein
MAIDTTDAKTAIGEIADELLKRLEALQEKTQMEDEHFASAVAATMTAAVDGGIKTMSVLKEIELKEKSMELIERQKEALDDARKVKTAELVGNTIAMIESGGTSAPAELWTALKGAVNNIDPENDIYPDPS